MNKEGTKKNLKTLKLAFFGMATIELGLLSYMLYYISSNLYSISHKGEVGAMLIGVVFGVVILVFIYVMLMACKEMRYGRQNES